MMPFSKFQSSKMIAVALSLGLMLLFQGCGAFRVFNNDKSVLGAHPVMITPCGWKLEDKFAGSVKDETTGKVYHKYTCGETILTIKDEELVVNGKSYGKLAKETDSVKVDGSKVFVNDREVQAVADTARADNAK